MRSLLAAKIIPQRQFLLLQLRLDAETMFRQGILVAKLLQYLL